MRKPFFRCFWWMPSWSSGWSPNAALVSQMSVDRIMVSRCLGDVGSRFVLLRKVQCSCPFLSIFLEATAIIPDNLHTFQICPRWIFYHFYSKGQNFRKPQNFWHSNYSLLCICLWKCSVNARNKNLRLRKS